MAKDGKRKKVKSKSSTKYATSSDEDNSSDDEDNLLTLFANLNMQQKEKLNELISAIHEKDDQIIFLITSIIITRCFIFSGGFRFNLLFAVLCHEALVADVGEEETLKVPFDPGTGSGCRLEGG